jgi:hypothetical protein
MMVGKAVFDGLALIMVVCLKVHAKTAAGGK